MSRFCIENKGEWDFPNRKWAIEPYWLVHDGVKNVSPTRIDDQFIGEVLDSLVGCIKATEAECDVWVDQADKLQSEIERLRGLVKRAYAEGFGDAWAIAEDNLNQVAEYGTCWDVSHARAALQPKEKQND